MEAIIPVGLYLATWFIVIWGANYFNKNVH
jgi:hypothetical protein